MCSGDESAAMNVEGCGLTLLSDFVNQVLCWTDNVRRILESECNEGRYALRPWPIETILTKEIHESCCTCDSKTMEENHVEEIVEGIGRALAQAQELREKIAINVSKQKRKMREPDVRSIYMPEISKTAANKEQALKLKKLSIQPAANKSCAGPSKGYSANVRHKNQVAVKKKVEYPAKNVEKKLLRGSAGNITSKGKTAKNIVANNKASLTSFKSTTVDPKSGFSEANCTRSKQLRAGGGGGTSQSKNSCSASIAELNRLMDKVSTEEAKRLSTTSSEELKDPNCPCHGAYAQNVILERIRTTVDIIEGVDRFGIPEDVVRILKMYQSYSAKESSSLLGEATVGDKRDQRAVNRFHNEFRLMNEQRDVDHTELANLIVGFGRLFQDLHSEQARVTSVAIKMRNRYVELDSRSKICQLRKFLPENFGKINNLENLTANVKGWSSNGVWYRAGLNSFPGFNVAGVRRACSIRYSNRDQLSSFFQLNQRYQQSLYHGCLIQFLMDKVIPEIRSRFQPDSPEYCEAYKMMFAIAQVLNPRISVLVRTDV